MRNLTSKQKKLLIEWYKAREPTREGKILLGLSNPLNKFEDLSTEQIEGLENINDTEVLYQNVNSFLNDIRETLN